MTDRERWIVYPLLAFALMLATKHQFSRYDVAYRQVRAESVRVGGAVLAKSEPGSVVSPKSVVTKFAAHEAEIDKLACRRLVVRGKVEVIASRGSSPASIVLVGKQGEPLVRLAIETSGAQQHGVVQVRDAQAGAKLTAKPGRAALTVQAAGDSPRIVVGLENGEPKVIILDAEGRAVSEWPE